MPDLPDIPAIEAGLCQCGCGTPTTLRRSRKGPGKGPTDYRAYAPGHMNRDPMQVIHGLKRCCICKTYKPVEAFRLLLDQAKNTQDNYRAYQSRCYACAKVLREKYHEREDTKQAYREGHLRRKYGISSEVFQQTLERQQYRCLICDKVFSQDDKPRANQDRPCVDHCHTSGEVRGVICGACNRALGLFGDNAQTVAKAANYLARFQHG